jgi:hypothetical protein
MPVRNSLPNGLYATRQTPGSLQVGSTSYSLSVAHDFLDRLLFDSVQASVDTTLYRTIMSF